MQELVSSKILSIVTFIYLGAFVLYLCFTITKVKLISKLASAVMYLAVISHSVAFFWRWKETYQYVDGYAPLTNMFESLSFFSLCLALLYCVVEIFYKERRFGVIIAPAASLILSYGALNSQEIHPLLPALKSNWLISHVVTCFLAYAAFMGAFLIGLLLLIIPIFPKKEEILPNPTDFKTVSSHLMHLTLVFGFVMLTVGILTGAVWAERAWGSYWSWDPKETFSLVTWLIYALALHLKVLRNWSDRKMSFMTTLGFLAVLCTYIGVNKYLPGLHSYGSF